LPSMLAVLMAAPIAEGEAHVHQQLIAKAGASGRRRQAFNLAAWTPPQSLKPQRPERRHSADRRDRQRRQGGGPSSMATQFTRAKARHIAELRQEVQRRGGGTALLCYRSLVLFPALSVARLTETGSRQQLAEGQSAPSIGKGSVGARSAVDGRPAAGSGGELQQQAVLEAAPASSRRRSPGVS